MAVINLDKKDHINSGILFFVSLSLLCAVCWLVGVRHVFPGAIQGLPVFQSVDDAYRYFYSLQSFYNLSLYHWSYMQPVAVLFDGVLAFITAHNIVLMRLLLGLLASVAMLALHRAGTHFGIKQLPLMTALLMLLLMPIFLTVSVSFYGEPLLFADLCFLIYFYSKKQQAGVIVTSALAPLIRPEGLLYLFFILIERAHKRRFLQCALILLPGILYGVYLLWSLTTPSDYIGWRLALDLVRSETVAQARQFAPDFTFSSVSGNLLAFFTTCNLLWWLLALMGLLRPRRLWPIYAGACLCLALQVFLTIIMAHAMGEARYLMPVFPGLTLAVASGLEMITSKIRASNGWQFGMAMLALLVAASIAENTAQLDPVRHQYFNDTRWLFVDMPSQSNEFKTIAASDDLAMQQVNTFLKEFSQQDDATKVIFVSEASYLKYMPVWAIKRYQIVIIPIAGRMVWNLFDGNIFGMSPTSPFFHFYNFHPAPLHTTAGSIPTALFIGSLPPFFPSIYEAGAITVHKVFFKANDSLPVSQ